ncbi:hypothetical protein GCM10023329_02910 [Streptomyces sanyensis]|uniref:Uncharacterized protein n=1 Tax=Streptomyces sanyensis TaxID=568869 RepID=A0ABP8ZP83_9ACTN
MTFSTGAAGGVDIDCEAGAGSDAGAMGAAANATGAVATTPASVALAAATAMSLRLEPFKVFLSKTVWWRGRAAREPWRSVGVACPTVPRAG